MKDFKDEEGNAYTWNQYAVWVINLLERLDKQVNKLEETVKSLELFKAHSSEEKLCEQIKDIQRTISALELINAQYTGEKLGKKATLAIIGAITVSVISLLLGIFDIVLKLK